MTHGGNGTGYAAGCRCDPCRAANRERCNRRRRERYAEPKDPNDPRHGTAAFYGNHGCRCAECSAAHGERCAASYARRLLAAGREPRRPRIPGETRTEREARYRAARYASYKDPTDPRHGTLSFYTNHGCRCAKCFEANAAETGRRTARRRIRRIPGPDLVDAIILRRLRDCLLNGPHQYTATVCTRCGL